MSIGFALLLGLGMVLVIEGLASPLRRADGRSSAHSPKSPETRRMIGLSAVACGVIVLALALGFF
jgi:uncharacterized protein YjeT (DUF2065 family)